MSRARILHAAVAMAALTAMTGCYRITVHSGLPESPAQPAINGSTRGGFVNGIVEDEPIRANGVCKTGWATLYIETSFLSGLLNSVRGIFYHVENITMRCAPEAPAPAPAPSAAPAAPGPAPMAPASPVALPPPGSVAL